MVTKQSEAFGEINKRLSAIEQKAAPRTPNVQAEVVAEVMNETLSERDRRGMKRDNMCLFGVSVVHSEDSVLGKVQQFLVSNGGDKRDILSAFRFGAVIVRDTVSVRPIKIICRRDSKAKSIILKKGSDFMSTFTTAEPAFVCDDLTAIQYAQLKRARVVLARTRLANSGAKLALRQDNCGVFHVYKFVTVEGRVIKSILVENPQDFLVANDPGLPVVAASCSPSP